VTSDPDPPPLAPRAALTVSLIVGVAAAAASALLARRETWGDFLAWWFGARVMLSGGNPYATPPDVAPFFVSEQLFYPGTALAVSAPFAMLPYLVALAAFFGIGSGLLAWGIARTAPHRLAVFCSFPFLMAAHLGHWSPWIAATLLVPSLGFLVAVKPNLGLAALVTRPSRPMLVGAALLVVASLVAMPSWPARWFAAMEHAPRHLVPIATWYGAPLALAILRWRRPEARLLLAMSLVPQTATFADQLMLFLVPQTQRQSLALALISAVGGVAWMLRLLSGGHPAIVGQPYVVASVYLPALILLWRRPNAGPAPEWLERRLAGLPRWLRGEPA
jgi:hypothetical protein